MTFDVIWRDAGIDLKQTIALAATSISSIAAQAKARIDQQAKEKEGEKDRRGSSSSTIGRGGGGGSDATEDAAAHNLQYVVNVKALVRLEDYCYRMMPVDADEEDEKEEEDGQQQQTPVKNSVLD